MSLKVIEVRIDLNNPNEKVIFNGFNVDSETKKHYYSDVGEWDRKHRRFLKGTLKTVLYGGALNYYYRFVTTLEWGEIEYCNEMKEAVAQLYNKLLKELNYYNSTLHHRKLWYNKDYEKEGVKK